MRKSIVWMMWLVAGLAHAGAWVPDPGAYYLKFGWRDLDTSRQFDANGDEVAAVNFQESSLDMYGEWGLAKRLGLWSSLAYKRVETDLEKNDGFGDLEVGLRYSLFNGPAGQFSAGASVKLPYLYDEDDPLRLGNGQEDFELRMQYGKGFRFAYTGAEVGYRWRLEDPSDEIRYLFELGAQLDRFYCRTKIDGIESADNGEIQDQENNPTLFNEYDLVKWELTAGFQIRRAVGLELTWTDNIDGRNTIAGDSIQLGITLIN